jgi:hypothetical protein
MIQLFIAYIYQSLSQSAAKHIVPIVNRTSIVRSELWYPPNVLGHSWGKECAGLAVKEFPWGSGHVVVPYVGSEGEMCDSPEAALCVGLKGRRH